MTFIPLIVDHGDECGSQWIHGDKNMWHPFPSFPGPFQSFIRHVAYRGIPWHIAQGLALCSWKTKKEMRTGPFRKTWDPLADPGISLESPSLGQEEWVKINEYHIKKIRCGIGSCDSPVDFFVTGMTQPKTLESTYYSHGHFPWLFWTDYQRDPENILLVPPQL